jgi:hypothetical protein
MAYFPKPPTTRILNWAQMVREADPDYTRKSLQPWTYEFSNGRRFLDPLPNFEPGPPPPPPPPSGMGFTLDFSNENNSVFLFV